MIAEGRPATQLRYYWRWLIEEERKLKRRRFYLIIKKKILSWF
jgi:hypothetical protein